MNKLNLKDAITNKKLDNFIKENENKVSDKQEFDKTINTMTNKSKPVRQTSTEDSSEN